MTELKGETRDYGTAGARDDGREEWERIGERIAPNVT
jgi:hypothetical protein